MLGVCSLTAELTLGTVTEFWLTVERGVESKTVLAERTERSGDTKALRAEKGRWSWNHQAYGQRGVGSEALRGSSSK